MTALTDDQLWDSIHPVYVSPVNYPEHSDLSDAPGRLGMAICHDRDGNGMVRLRTTRDDESLPPSQVVLNHEQALALYEWLGGWGERLTEGTMPRVITWPAVT